ncbi:HepT-like ribonuclease domain-containing protein [Bradyrhizobium sp. 15]|uniref:HepT-like ribonuclease domain-containing protein n=1 Tax=Bradyrhizobium sp. 15 TaxID=2782633 RepID=UPI001FF9ED5B|nr:HepT-like ribonuclease domain-containing protein [Bradyrhizobium sp. 15]MCK1439852.1 DUF86 domain-containing protein [Bradyrhizobium sp. 15]
MRFVVIAILRWSHLRHPFPRHQTRRLIISEAAKTLPAELKEAAPDIAWRKIETLGNFLRHEYRDVDPDLIWNITQENLPGLVQAARKLVSELKEPALT